MSEDLLSRNKLSGEIVLTMNSEDNQLEHPLVKQNTYGQNKEILQTQTSFATIREINESRKRSFQIRVYLITYLGYAVIHFQREFWSLSKKYITKESKELTKDVLSRFDTAQLLTYAIVMYIGGILGDQYNQRIVLTIAYLVLSVAYLLQGLAGILDISNQAYFYFVSILIGAFNSLLPPTFIGIMGNWFPKKNRGLIVGFWATCNNFGNIVGIQIAAGLMILFDNRWYFLMVTISIVVLIAALIIFLFLIPEPEMAGIQIEEYTQKEAIITSLITDQSIRNSITTVSPLKLEQDIKKSQIYGNLSQNNVKVGRINFFKAWLLPKVFLYSLSFFCTKLAVYSLLLWLPLFLSENLNYQDSEIANLSTILDLGAIVGSMTLGLLSDLTYGKRSPIAMLAVIISITISYVLTYEVLNMATALFFVLMFFLGFFISGLNNVINAACAADLGKQEALQGNQKAISTVTGIIDGSGTLGTAVGQFIIGFTQKSLGWQNGYWLVISIDISLTVIPLVLICIKEFNELKLIKVGVEKLRKSSMEKSLK
ncbi:sugar phosphate exchanger 3 [Stylonychia lemnae]|uniref:Sugar phosphate exchanger 3 n=1 Tax=Stylonychia lemnae TaxID=5949 RepID=A0A078AE21_STYLE|nr:sugar phosphate exchanger 3 [Stylonychia lemnae]|eukprot:CDW80091.1 sugar phosphate exchanger 3 [Stylonychia lemnae]